MMSSDPRGAVTYSPTFAVPSALSGLTSLFGMGRGGALTLLPPSVRLRLLHSAGLPATVAVPYAAKRGAVCPGGRGTDVPRKECQHWLICSSVFLAA